MQQNTTEMNREGLRLDGLRPHPGLRMLVDLRWASRVERVEAELIRSLIGVVMQDHSHQGTRGACSPRQTGPLEHAGSTRLQRAPTAEMDREGLRRDGLRPHPGLQTEGNSNRYQNHSKRYKTEFFCQGSADWSAQVLFYR